MREILFRGKTRTGEWVQGDYEHFYVDGITYPIISRWGNFTKDVIPETVGQYTGLTDKNGKKIFEGDIIRYADIYEYEIYLESLEHPEDFTECVFDNMWTVDKVIYCTECNYPAFDLCSHDFEVNGLCELSESMQYHFEVIGNIYDNPELLKGGAEE